MTDSCVPDDEARIWIERIHVTALLSCDQDLSPLPSLQQYRWRCKIYVRTWLSRTGGQMRTAIAAVVISIVRRHLPLPAHLPSSGVDGKYSITIVIGRIGE